jgi:quercetin dioxygenase-like cupin family protein
LTTEDPARELTIARPDDPGLLHLAVVGDTYTVLISGEQTAGRYAMLDMLIPPGGGPPPHRHGFDESFRVLEGSIEVSLVGETPIRLGEDDTVNIPGGAAHSFRNASDAPARLLCTVVPSGLERFFAEFADVVPTRTSPAPELTDAERAERLRRSAERAADYGFEILPPAGAVVDR